jgi:hypothetical protein
MTSDLDSMLRNELSEMNLEGWEEIGSASAETVGVNTLGKGLLGHGYRYHIDTKM